MACGLRLQGGDPSNVTVAGESAGGTSVLSLLASPSANTLFHKCVPMSFMSYQTLTLDEAATIASSFAAAAGLSEATRAAFANKTFEEILATTLAPSEHGSNFVNIAPGWMDIGGAMLGRPAPAYPGKLKTKEGTRMMHRYSKDLNHSIACPAQLNQLI